MKPKYSLPNISTMKKQSEQSWFLRAFISLIVFLVLIIIFCFSAFFFTFSNSVNTANSDFEKSVSSIFNKVNKSNLKVKALISNNDFDYNKSQDSLPNIIEELSNEKSELLNLIYPNEYEKKMKNTINALNQNIDMFNYLSRLILKDPSDQKNDLIKSMNSSHDKAVELYNLVKFKNFDIGIQSDTSKYIDAATKYFKSTKSATENS